MSARICLLVAALVATARPAHAEHDDIQRITDNTAHVLRPAEWRVGLWKVQYRLPSRPVEVGTYTMYWAPMLGGIPLLNGHAKWTFHHGKRWTFAASLGLFYLDLAILDSPVTFTLVPMDVYASRRLGDTLELALRGTYTGATIEGSYDSDEIGGLQGAVGGESVQAMASLIWRRSARTAYLAELRVGQVLGVYGSTESTVRVDEHTTVDVVGGVNATTDELAGASIAGRVHWSWQRFNLRLGLTYGNYTIGGINFMVPTAIPVPELDLYWRF